MMFFLIVLVLLIVAGVAAVATGAITFGKKTSGGVPARRRPLDRRAQGLYNRLREAMPEQVVLAQVAFSSLLMARDRTLRHSFRAKVAGFVVCTRHFDVIAIVQLSDDPSRRREPAEKEDDALLSSSGYKVLRYAEVPDAATLKADLAKLPVPEAPRAAPASPRPAAQAAPDTLPALDL